MTVQGSFDSYIRPLAGRFDYTDNLRLTPAKRNRAKN